jgi:hypothetical protein
VHTHIEPILTAKHVICPCPLDRYGVIPRLLPELPRSSNVLDLEIALEEVVMKAVQDGLCPAAKQVRGFVLFVFSHCEH